MKRKSCLQRKLILLLLIGTAMTSCASTQGREQGTAGPTPPETVPASRVTTTPPRETCAVFLPSAPCGAYVSIAGTADGVELPWATSGGLTVQLSSVNGSLYVTAKTPCSPVSGPATITGNTLVAGELGIGAMGCISDAGTQQQWFVDFLKRPIEMSFSQGTLNWKSGTDTLTFKVK
ncbi:hypothetical protein GCM10017710_21550 [Arthrobacter ramosus]